MNKILFFMLCMIQGTVFAAAEAAETCKKSPTAVVLAGLMEAIEKFDLNAQHTEEEIMAQKALLQAKGQLLIDSPTPDITCDADTIVWYDTLTQFSKQANKHRKSLEKQLQAMRAQQSEK